MEPLSNGKALLFPYLIPSKTPTGAIIICPGGGYAGLAAHEGEPVARWANSLGYAAFVLHYSLCHHPAPLEDAQWAIRLVRSEAEQVNLTTQTVVMGGASIGLHTVSPSIMHPTGAWPGRN